MGRLRLLVVEHGLDALIIVAAIWSAIGTAVREDASAPTGATAWFEVLAIAAVVLTLVLRRRFPFAAPAGVWLASVALSFVDGRLVTSQGGVYLAGLGAALLLGNVRNDVQARIGLAIVVSGAAIVVYNDPTHRSGSLVFTPVAFVIGWLVGYALRERTEQTEAAEERAERAERDREAAARVAVAEERGRIARELHDVVAHAVSVMVLQVGAVRHRMPASDAENREALQNVEQAGRTALAEMRRLLGAMRRDDEQAELAPHPGLALPPARGADGHPDARARRTRGHSADPGGRRVRASAHPHDLQPRRVRLRGAARRSERVRPQGRPSRAADRRRSHQRGR